VKIKLSLLMCGLIASVGLAAFDQTTHTVEIDLPVKIDFSDGFQQSDADAILKDCEADNIELKVDETGEITFEPSLNADYDASMCVLQYIKKSGTTKFGFVGNEKYVTPEEGQ
jgi:hypothetical protein